MYFGYAWNRIEVIETKRAENSQGTEDCPFFFGGSYQDTILLVRYEVVLNGVRLTNY